MQLPVYQQQGNLSGEAAGQLVSPYMLKQTGRALEGAVNVAQDIHTQWQQAKDYSESLDGKNKLNSGISDVLTEAKSYSDYKNPKELQEKEQEYLERLNTVNTNITSGFTNNENAARFNQEAQISVMKNKEALKGIFRSKYIDNAKSNLIVSQNTNQENFISTGNTGYIDSYKQDLEGAFAAGYISEEYKTKQMQNVEEWNNYRALRDAETDPDMALQNLQDGKYNISDKYYNEVLSDMKSIKSNNQLINEMKEVRQQDVGESEATDFVNGTQTYDEKLKYLNEQEFMGNISTEYATKARRMIKQYKPEGGLSNADAISDILLRATDLQSDDEMKSKEYLLGIRNVRQDILDKQAAGVITKADAVKLNNQITQLTKSKTADETNDLGNSMRDARNYINDNLPPEYRNQALRDTFYAVDSIDKSKMNWFEQGRLNKQTAVKTVEQIKAKTRENAQKRVEQLVARPNETIELTRYADVYLKDLEKKLGTKITIVPGGRYRDSKGSKHKEGKAADISLSEHSAEMRKKIFKSQVENPNVYMIGTSDPELLKLYGNNPKVEDERNYDKKNNTNHINHMHVTLKTGQGKTSVSSDVTRNKLKQAGYSDAQISAYLKAKGMS